RAGRITGSGAPPPVSFRLITRANGSGRAETVLREHSLAGGSEHELDEQLRRGPRRGILQRRDRVAVDDLIGTIGHEALDLCDTGDIGRVDESGIRLVGDDLL